MILDQGSPQFAVAEPAPLGISAEHVGELGLAAAADDVILDEARRRDAVVVTLDADFMHY